MDDLTIKQHDTRAQLQLVAKQLNATTGLLETVNLTTASEVRVIGRPAGGDLLFSRAVAGGPLGQVTMPWQAADTAVAQNLRVEVQATWPDGTVQTFPNDGYVIVKIVPDLG